MTIAEIDEDLADRLVEQRVEMARVDEQEEEEEPERHARRRSSCENLPCAVSTVTSRRRSMRARMFVDHLVEHLRRVAAGLALDEREDGDLVHVGVLHPLRGHLERLVERDPELLVGDDAGELALRRLGRLVGDDAHRAREAVAGAKRGGEHVEVLGQLLAELVAHACAPCLRTKRLSATGGDDREEEPERADEDARRRRRARGPRAREIQSISARVVVDLRDVDVLGEALEPAAAALPLLLLARRPRGRGRPPCAARPRSPLRAA